MKPRPVTTVRAMDLIRRHLYKSSAAVTDLFFFMLGFFCHILFSFFPLCVMPPAFLYLLQPLNHIVRLVLIQKPDVRDLEVIPQKLP